MKKVLIDTALWQDKKQLHQGMKDALSFPDYYGHNLDALHDMLTEMDETELTLLNTHSLYIRFGSWAYIFLRVIMESASENKRLHLILI